MDASGRQTPSGNKRKVLGDIAEMRSRFVESMAQLELQQVIGGIKVGHQDIDSGITDALADPLLDRPGDPHAMTSARDRLEQHMHSDVMDSQRLVHAAVTGQPVQTSDPRPRIELF